MYIIVKIELLGGARLLDYCGELFNIYIHKYISISIHIYIYKCTYIYQCEDRAALWREAARLLR